MSPSKSVISPPSSMTSRFASVTLANKMFVKEIGKNFEYLTNILLQFLRFGDIEIPIVIHILKTSV